MAEQLALPSDWQLECEDTNERVGRILAKQQWTDCSFVVGLETLKELKAHKLILAVASPVFEAMFYGPMAEQDVIDIPDIEPGVFEIMLKYIYTNAFEFDSKIMKVMFGLYSAAQKYMLSKLMSKLLINICNSLNGSNACLMYEFALFNGIEDLVTRCENMIMLNTESVLSSESFLNLHMETVTNIFSFEVLNASELHLVRAAERYDYYTLKAQQISDNSTVKNDVLQQAAGVSVPTRNLKGKRKGISNKNGVRSSKTKYSQECHWGTKKEKADRPILALLHKIRFLTLSPKELIDDKDVCRLLTSVELVGIMSNASAAPGNNFLPMPEGFSTNRNQRSKFGVQATLTCTAANISDGSGYQSDTCYIGSSPWYIKIKRQPASLRERRVESLSVFLYFGGEIEEYPADWSCYVAAKVKLVSQKSGDSFSLPLEKMFTTKSYCGGWRNFISWEDLMKIESPYVKDDSITVEAHVFATSEIKVVRPVNSKKT